MVFVLSHLVAELGRRMHGPPLRITVVDPNDELGTGTPYATRGGTWPLLLTSARHLLPGDAENAFIRWLRETPPAWLDVVRAGTPRERAWLAEHEAAVAGGDFADLYLPRHVFGAFLRERLRASVDAARAGGLARVRFVPAAATAITRTGPRGLAIRTANAAHPLIPTATLVLATGSAPPAASPADGAVPGYVHDIYRAGHLRIERQIRDDLAGARPHDGRVVIAGSNAAATEMLHLLATSPELLRDVRRVAVVSPSGRLPDLRDVRSGVAPACERLHALADLPGAQLTAEALYAALRADVNEARRHGALAEDLAPCIPPRVLALLGRAPRAERRAFLGLAAALLLRILRRTGGPYARAASLLDVHGRLERIAGSVREVNADGRTGFVLLRDGRPPETLDGALAIINCTGSARLDDDPRPLMRSILAGGASIARVTPSGRGLVVSARFEASPGVFVMGPLLAGYTHRDLHVWRLEVVARIESLAPRLARVLARRLLDAAHVRRG